MLRAVDADPQVCGYPPAVQRRLLAELGRLGVRAERPLVEHLARLLAQRGLIPEPRLGCVAAGNHPEILKLRFDPERSPLREIPGRLRRPLLELFDEDGTEIVRRQGSEWVELETDEDDGGPPDRWTSWATDPDRL